MDIDKENVVQAVVIMDTFNSHFNPINKNKPMGLLPVAGVPLINYILESLAQGGVGEAILFCCQDGPKIKNYIRQCMEDKAIWSFTMDVQVKMSDTCQTMGDVMREIDAAGLIRGYFVLTGVNTITNIHFASLLEQHKQICKKDKGAAMTLVYKKVAWEHPLISSDKPMFLAADAKTHKVLIHQKYKPKSSEKTINLPLVCEIILFDHNYPPSPFLFRTTYAGLRYPPQAVQTILSRIMVLHLFSLPYKLWTFVTDTRNNSVFWDTGKVETRVALKLLIIHALSCVTSLEVVLNNSEVKLHHNLADANIALCSPSVPPLFSDNFDFQTRDDFIHGILINEEILASSLYYTLLKGNQYAAAVTNWRTYQTVCQDVLHNWAYPLTIESGSFSQNKFLSMGIHNFREKSSTLSRSCTLLEDVLIGAKTHVNDNTVVSKSFIGQNCIIGNNVIIQGSHIMNNIVIKDNCKIINSFIDDNCVIEDNCSIDSGTVIASNIKVDAGSQLKGKILESTETDKEKVLLTLNSENTEWDNESSGSGGDDFIGFEKNWNDSESCYSSDSSAESSLPDSPVPDDTNIFLQEVIDSLARGYEEKLKCDYLILEINSSRYAYNIQLHEVNFFVVRALLSIPVLSETKNVLGTVRNILQYFRPVLANYIKTKSSIMDCLRAVEDSCIKCEWLDGQSGLILKLLYDADVVDEDSLVEWHKDSKENESPIVKQNSLVKFFQWLEEASEESDDSE